ncbi:hypothetical protein HYC85_029220 [Camellia sinensis]|uniref:Uncharacterized protein n=1 Tax=Camellia sinensis TaxID=4442 RepID=A0A7J7FXL8_CAMSI|nr:hypothetical protein HYC85_029220 [Camellia sinensis]
MGIVELNRCLRIDLGVPAIRHCYALAKSSGRLGRNLKKILVFADDAVFSQIATALGYFGRPNLQKQGRAAYILLRYEPTYTTFSAADNIPIPSGDQQLAALIFPSFKSLRQVGLKASNSGQDVEPVVEVVAEPDREFAEEAEEVDEALNSAFEAARRSMAGESPTQMARKKNAERMAARSGPALVESSEPVIEEPAKIVEAKTAKEVEQPVIDERLIPEERGKKRSAEREAGSEDSLANKRPRLEESDVVVPFIVQPEIRDTPIPSDASIITDPAVAFSLAASVSLPADKASFHVVPDLSAQSALLTVGRIADLGRRQHDALERIDHLQSEVVDQKSRAEFEMMRAVMETARAESEVERARAADQHRSEAEDRANLAELKAAKEKAESEASAAFEAGKGATFKEYVDEVPRFENRGFKHGWLKALGAAGVTLALPIPYEQVDVEPLESDPED